MALFTNLRTNITSYIFKKRNKKSLLRFVNIKEAKDFIILFKIDSKTTAESVNYLKQKLTNKNITLLQIVTENQELLTEKVIPVKISDFNFLYKPKKEIEFLSIIDRKYDVLIDLTEINDSFLTNLITLIKSNTKICKYKKSVYYNLMIKVAEESSIEDFIDQAIIYLTSINSKKNDGNRDEI